jgi:uncharacterized repeat protein (TIGR03803 family)
MRPIARASLLVSLLTLFLVSLAQATKENTIYSFGGGGTGDGMYPYSQPVFDAKGNMYGTTLGGGTHDAGMIFELSPSENGQWIETVLYEFTGQADGGYPYAGLVFDKSGNLYGTGGYGGTNGSGVVFELSPNGSSWTYSVLYSFGAYPTSGDGFAPNSTVVFDNNGNIFGTTNEGGIPGCFEGCGAVFELSPNGVGGWTEKLIHEFPSGSKDGELPTGGLTLNTDGNLYGTTQNGGTAGSGVLNKLSYSSSKKEWVESIVHQFVGGKTRGSFPVNALLLADEEGNLYGTTEGGGANSQGTVFETARGKAGWKTTVLYSFNKEYTGDGQGPEAGLIMDKKGNLYGTTLSGGAYHYYGTVFKLSKSENGEWAETVLHSFNGNDGLYPEASLTIRGGWLYGTATSGGNNTGVVFRVRP